MIKKSFFNFVLLLIVTSCSVWQKKNIVVSDQLEIQKLSQHTFLHRSFLVTESWGKVGCNGLIYVKDKHAFIFDTPTNDQASQELINYIANELEAKIDGIVVNHFHIDCLGGLKTFHDKGIPSYSSNKTILFAKADTTIHSEIPQNGFDSLLVLKIGDSEIVNRFFGEAHTRDNIVSYLPDEKVLFGGCMIKEIGAGEGYLGDANIATWSKTVNEVKKTFPEIKIVVPGHGKPGDVKLLDYTISLFEQSDNSEK